MLSIKDFNYHLPEERIAQYPLAERDQSKLLIYNKGNIREDVFFNLVKYLPEGSILFANNTRVINARIIFQKFTGAQIEILCLEPYLPADYSLAFQQQEEILWTCMVGNLKKWKNEILEKTIISSSGKIKLYAQLIDNEGNSQKVKFYWTPGHIPFGTVLETAGFIPLPPYIHRKAEEVDSIRYQTIFSKDKGSIAAPTAGLHFTEQVINQLKENNIPIEYLTLHVGAGTFRPVKHENALEHDMHNEHFVISLHALKQIKTFFGNITAVGTTTLRALESTYWLGLKLMLQNNTDLLSLGQWEYKNLPQKDFQEVIEFLIDYCNKHKYSYLNATTRLMITPGYPFKIVNRLITNFHQPQSTLLLLVAAFVGTNQWKTIYDYALNNNFRFLSYGDSSLLIP